MKSHASDKKHAKSDNHKSNHKSDHKADSKEHKDHKDHKEKDHKADPKAVKHADKQAKAQPEAEKQVKGLKKDKNRASAAVAVPAVHAEEKPTRLALIKARHESMKREIDQIREDLESDEDE